jgi:putative tricarboxylic transport membrane protein
VVNSPGAGGTIALAEFINARRGDGHSLMLGGLVMLGAIHANGATVSLLQTTPLARLIAEPEVIVVRSDAPRTKLFDIVAAMKSEPGALVWTGGAYGGVDHLLLQLVADAVGVDRSSINYIPHAGGGEGLRALLSGQGMAGVCGYAEFAEARGSGKLRAVAISSEKRLPNVQIPTLKELGVDVAVMNWRGAFAPPDLAPVDRERLATAIDRMVHQPAWQRMLTERGWTDVYLSGEPYVKFVDAERRRIDEYFVQADRREHHNANLLGRRTNNGQWTFALAAVVLTAVLGSFWFGRTRTAAVRELALRRQLEDARTEIAGERDRVREFVNGLGDEIDKQFEKWGLTAAEREVALLILKGLRHKEIAVARNTTEGTVRQQALMVYKKAGLDGRTDLAAFFLEDLLPPRNSGERPIDTASC